MLGEAQRGRAVVVAASDPAQPTRRETGRVALLFPVRPVEGESLLSVVCRAAALNHLPTPRPALAHIGAPYGSKALHARRDLAPALARLVGVAPEAVLSRLYGPRTKPAPGLDDEQDFFGTRIPAHWLTHAKRIAPGAFAGSPHHRAVWDLAILDVCPESGERLVDACPRCGRHLNWKISVIPACSACGFDLVRAGAFSAREIPDADFAGARFVADLLAPWRGRRAAALRRVPEALRASPIVELVRLALVLPDILLGGGCDRRKMGAKWKARDRRPHLALTAGVAALEEWPASLHAALDRRSAMAPSGRRYGVVKHLGPAFLSLLRHYDRAAAKRVGPSDPRGSAYGILLTEIGAYFASRPGISFVRNPRLASLIRAAVQGGSVPCRAVPMISISRATGWSHERLRCLAGLWPEVVVHSDGRGRGAPTMLDADRVQSIVSTLEAALSLPEVAVKLGVPRKLCRELVARGLFRRLDDRFLEIHGKSRTSVLLAGDSVEDVFARLAAGAQGDRAVRPLTPMAVVSHLSKFGLGYADALAMMLDGRLRYHKARQASSSRTGGFPYAFEKESVDLFCAARRQGLPMSVNTAAAELRWSQQTVLSMLLADEMRVLPGRGKHSARLIPRTEVARAKVDYLSTAQVGARMVPAPLPAFARALAREMARLGHEPVVGGGGAAARNGQLIWRARDITEADHRALSDWAHRSGWTRAAGRRAVHGGGKA